jgi:hypothetical protein
MNVRSDERDWSACWSVILIARATFGICAAYERHPVYALPSWCCVRLMLLQAEDAAGGPVDHPGAMLFNFLKRYGMSWNLNKDAVAVAQGGVVSRDSLATLAGPFAGQDKLAVKDPLSGVYQTLALAS